MVIVALMVVMIVYFICLWAEALVHKIFDNTRVEMLWLSKVLSRKSRWILKEHENFIVSYQLQWNNFFLLTVCLKYI